MVNQKERLVHETNYSHDRFDGYLQVAAWSGADLTSRFDPMDTYLGVGNVFTMTPGSGTVYNSILNFGGSTYQTEGIVDSTTSVYIGIIPEPGSLALAGLGAAVMLVFCRRK